MSRIDLRIDRLVLEGLDLAPGDAHRLGAAIEQELSDLIARDGAPKRASHDWRIDAPSVVLESGGNVQGWGRQIAQSIHQSLPSQSLPGGKGNG